MFRAVAAVGAFVLAFSPQLLAYNALNGHPGPTDLVTRKMTWTSPHALQVLFSPEHGLFAWTPMALLAIAGMVALAAGRRDGDARLIGALCLVMIALQVYVTGAVESWTLAGSFGQRRFVSLTPLLTIGLAMLFGMTVARLLFRVLLVSVVILCLWWNLGLMAQFGMHLMDRQRLDLPHNARMTFVVLPRAAPAIVWRYLTDRSSFYRVPPLVLRTDELR